MAKNQFAQDKLHFILDVLLNPEKDLSNLDRYEYELLGFDPHKVKENGGLEAPAIRMAVRYALFALLKPLLPKEGS